MKDDRAMGRCAEGDVHLAKAGCDMLRRIVQRQMVPGIRQFVDVADQRGECLGEHGKPIGEMDQIVGRIALHRGLNFGEARTTAELVSRVDDQPAGGAKGERQHPADCSANRPRRARSALGGCGQRKQQGNDAPENVSVSTALPVHACLRVASRLFYGRFSGGGKSGRDFFGEPRRMVWS